MRPRPRHELYKCDPRLLFRSRVRGFVGIGYQMEEAKEDSSARLLRVLMEEAKEEAKEDSSAWYHQ